MNQEMNRDTNDELPEIPELAHVAPIPTPEATLTTPQSIQDFLDGNTLTYDEVHPPDHPVPINIRESRPSDYNFILKAWLTGAKGYVWNQEPPQAFYFLAHRDQIAAVASRPNTVCLVACEEGDPENLFAFIVAERAHVVRGAQGETIHAPLVVHYAYTKRAFRKMDIARRLLQSAGWSSGMELYASHSSYILSKDNARLQRAYMVKYVPYAFFDPTWYRNLRR